MLSRTSLNQHQQKLTPKSSFRELSNLKKKILVQLNGKNDLPYINGQLTNGTNSTLNPNLLSLQQNGSQNIKISNNNNNSNKNNIDYWGQKTQTLQFLSQYTLPKPMYVLTVEVEEQDVLNPDPILEQISKCINRNLCNAVMIRDCKLPSSKLLKIAPEIFNLCESLGVNFLVEERIEVAAACGAQGIVVNSLVDIKNVRMLLERCGPTVPKTRWVSESGDMNILDNNNQIVRHVFCGRTVHDEHQAQFAERDEADFVVVDVDPRIPLSDRELRLELRGIRRRITKTVIVSHQFCKACGGPKTVMNSHADGLQIPLEVLIPLLSEKSGEGAQEVAQQLPSGDRLAGAIMLVAGGTIGAGIIALPVKTAAAGFIPTSITLTCSWFFMCLTAFLLLEMSVWYGPGTNLTTMAENTIGRTGKFICATLYLFIYTATITAYVAEGARYVMAVLEPIVGGVPMWVICLGFATVFGGVVQAGTNWADKVNSICVTFALSAYAYLLTFGSQQISLSNLMISNWSATVPTLPIMVVAFCFHNIVPSLLGYLGNARRVFIAIAVGSFIPLVMYLLWEGVILGSLSTGMDLNSAEQIIEGMRAAAGDQAVVAVTWFSLLAIITSFLGVLLGFLDFNRELMFKKGNQDEGSMWSLEGIKPLLVTLLPPLAIAVSAPGIFYSAMEFSGTLRMILFGVLPVFMVWIGRKQPQNRQFLPGGKSMLIGIMFVALSMITVEVRSKVIDLANAVL